MVRRMLVTLATLVAAVGACASPEDAAFHYENVGGSATGFWNSCPHVAVGAPCAFTLVEAETVRTNADFTVERSCVFILQFRRVKLADYVVQGPDNTYANAC